MVAWAERWPRAVHDVVFTPIGGRRRTGDPLGILNADLRRDAERRVTQVALIAPVNNVRIEDPELDCWVTVCRKVLQRGRRPPISPRVAAMLHSDASEASAADVMAAIAKSASTLPLDPAYELHPQWELPFWERAQVIAPDAASWLIPQAPLEALVTGKIPPQVGRRWVDFLYAPPGRAAVVFEIDGAGHDRRSDADRARDTLLASAGVAVIRASGRASIDPVGPLFRRMREAITPGIARPDLVRAVHDSSAPARLALAVVEAAMRGLLPKGGPWSLEVEDRFGTVDEIAGAALDPLRAISELWHLGVVPSSVQVNGRHWRLSGEAEAPQRSPGRVAPTVRVRLEPDTPFFASLSGATDLPEITIRRAGVPVDLQWLPGTTAERRVLRRSPDTDLHLHLLLADLFGHETFREDQLASLRQALSGGDSVVLLPTGAGKSLIYQLAGLLMPGTTLVIDPLVSLIDDQETRLIRDGIERVVAMHASRGGGSRARDLALASVASGDAHFIFLTPERFQNQRFRDHLRESSRDQLINLAVIDEAHTVSEWGHDFRTSYLRLARNVRRLCRDRRNLWPPMLALTGTAGPAVLRDVLRELEIDAEAEGAVQRPLTHDRPNLCYHKITGPDAEWLDLVVDGVTDVVTQCLGVELADLATLDGLDTVSGIVFCPWARGEHGVGRVRDALMEAFAAKQIELGVEVYAATAPTGDATRPDWAEQRTLAAERFKTNQVALLVATKAFGMGIDKPNIRYTVHAGFPSSIEAFAQEAGRSGRDGRPAACVLTVALPEDEDAAQLLDRSLPAEERRKLVDKTRDVRGGDLRRQLWFHGNSFPGALEEADLAMKLYRWLLDRGGGPGRTVVIAIRPKAGEDPRDHDRRKGRADRALFRLAALGVVDDLTIDGPEITVHLGDYAPASIDSAFLAYTSRIEPGNETSYRQRLAAAPTELTERLAHHIAALTEAVYRIVASARLTAVDNMYQLARGSSDPEYLRARINAYLGDGPAAAILAEAVAIIPINIPRFVASLETLPVSDVDELAGASARQREAYPNHPLLWFSTALSIAREVEGDEQRFREALGQSLLHFGEYQVEEAQTAAAIAWLVRRLRAENDGRRWDWAGSAIEAWDAHGLGLGGLRDIEDEALLQAQRGRFNARELNVVARRRLRRHAAEVAVLADRYVPAPSDPGRTQ